MGAMHHMETSKTTKKQQGVDEISMKKPATNAELKGLCDSDVLRFGGPIKTKRFPLQGKKKMVQTN